jgi:hypothetical protein
VTRIAGVTAATVIVAALSACGGSTQATVPSQVRDRIVKNYPTMAFVPGRLPNGYRYKGLYFLGAGKGYELSFARRGAAADQIGMWVGPDACSPWRHHSRRVNDHTISSEMSSMGMMVWRCTNRQGRPVIITGDGGTYGTVQELDELVGYAAPTH